MDICHCLCLKVLLLESLCGKFSCINLPCLQRYEIRTTRLLKMHILSFGGKQNNFELKVVLIATTSGNPEKDKNTLQML